MKKIIAWFLLTLFLGFFASDMQADTLYLGDCVLQNNDPVAPDSFWVKVRKNGVLDTTFTFAVSDSNEYGCYDSPYVFTGDGAVYTIWVGFVVSGDTIFTRTEMYHSYSWIGDDLDSIYDTLLKIQDSTEAYDNWVASEANVTKTLDSLADVLDSLETISAWLQDSLFAIIDTLQNQDNWISSEANVNKALDSLADILDTLRNYDNWIAKEASVSKTLNSLGVVIDSLETQSTWIQDSMFAILDSNQAQSIWIQDSLFAIIDTLQNQDDWVATALGMDSLLNNYISIAGDIVDTVANTSSLFKTNLSNAVNDHYNDLLLVFSTGTNAGQARIVGDYDGAKKVITVNTAFEAEPAAGDDFAIMFNAGTAATIDSLYALLDSIQDMYGWVAYQTTVDSVYAINDSILDTLLKIQDSIDAKVSTAGSEAAVSQDDIDKICSLTADTLTNRGLFDSIGQISDSIVSLYALGDSTLDTLLNVQDSLYAGLDTLQNQDNWIATSAGVDSLHNSYISIAGDIVDTVANTSSLFKTNLSNAVNDHYNDLFLVFSTGTNAGQARIIGDYDGAKKVIVVTAAFEAEPSVGDDFIIVFNAGITVTQDSLFAILDSIQAQSIWIQDSLFAIIDTLQNQDNWIASEANVTKALDSLSDILDSLEAQSTWIQDSLFAVLDSIQSQSTWIQDSLFAIIDTLQNQDDWISSFDPTTTSVITFDTLTSGDTIARQKDSSSFQGDITTVWTSAQIDSIMDMTTRQGVYWGSICDTTLMIGYPIGYKPKDSLRIFCITNAMADTTYVGTIRSSIINKVRSITNVEDTILFIR